jgi:hypothetical protein
VAPQMQADVMPRVFIPYRDDLLVRRHFYRDAIMQTRENSVMLKEWDSLVPENYYSLNSRSAKLLRDCFLSVHSGVGPKQT